MGAEFLKKTRDSNAKCIDRSRVDLATPDLFTQTPQRDGRNVVAKLERGSTLKAGSKVIMEADGGSLKASVGNRVEATSMKPPADVVKGIALGGGLAKGVVGKVNKLSNTVEISVC